MFIEQSVLAVWKYMGYLQGELLDYYVGTKAAYNHLLEYLENIYFPIFFKRNFFVRKKK